MNRPDDGTQSPADTARVLYVDDDQLLLDLQTDIAAEREALELVTTTNSGRALALLDDNEFDYVVVGSRRPGATAGEFAREVHAAHPDNSPERYTWDIREDGAAEVFDSALEKRVEAAGTIQLLDRVRWLDD